jgi:predicted AAA+ superfamily ATPase
MISRILSLPPESCFLFGPRGTGKTFFLRINFPTAIYIDLLKAEVYNRLMAHPERLREMIPTAFDDVVIIDEVQKVPKILDEVHYLMENRGIRFILTGSNARKLKQTQANMLAGRALTFHMHTLTVEELQDDFDLSKSLIHGHLPSLYDENKKTIDPEHYLQSYLQTYLKEEVQQEGLTRNLEAFSRFLEAASFSQGETLNISAVARECHVSRKLAESYFQILEDLLIAFTVPVFQKKAKRKLSSHPKFFFFDVGVYRSLRPKGPLDSPEEIDGAALETLIYQEVRAWLHYHRINRRLYFWRTQAGNEVDMVIYGDEGLWAIEIKRSKRFNAKQLGGLRAFKEDYPIAKCLLLYGGEEKLSVAEVTVLPICEFLTGMTHLLK